MLLLLLALINYPPDLGRLTCRLLLYLLMTPVCRCNCNDNENNNKAFLSVLNIFRVGNLSTVLTEYIAAISERSNIAKKKKKVQGGEKQQLDNQTGLK